MIELLLVGLGGFLGAIARYSLSSWAHRAYEGAFPVGTLAVNLLGCFAIGCTMALLDRGRLSPQTHLFLTTGLLGALTTFSTFGFEAFELLRKGLYSQALGSVMANLVLGLLAVGLGLVASRAW